MLLVSDPHALSTTQAAIALGITHGLQGDDEIAMPAHCLRPGYVFRKPGGEQHYVCAASSLKRLLRIESEERVISFATNDSGSFYLCDPDARVVVKICEVWGGFDNMLAEYTAA